MSSSLERGRALEDDLMKKGKELEKLNRIIEELENERSNNQGQMDRMKGKLDELAQERNRIRKDANEQ